MKNINIYFFFIQNEIEFTSLGDHTIKIYAEKI